MDRMLVINAENRFADLVSVVPNVDGTKCVCIKLSKGFYLSHTHPNLDLRNIVAPWWNQFNPIVVRIWQSFHLAHSWTRDHQRFIAARATRPQRFPRMH